MPKNTFQPAGGTAAVAIWVIYLLYYEEMVQDTVH